MAVKKVVVLGGGVGGTIVANLLAKRFRPEEAEVTLVDKTGKHVYQPGFVYVAFGRTKPKSLVRDERKLLRKRVRLVIGEAVRIDPAGRKVHLADGIALDYARLVIALGARLVPDELPGYAEAAHHFYSLEGALKLKEALRAFRGGRIVVTVASRPDKGPPPLSRVFPLEPVNPVVEQIFAKHDIQSTIFFNVESIDTNAKTVTSIEGETVPYDLLLMIPPHRGAKVVEDSGLGDRGGWLPTDKHTLRTKAHLA